MGLQLRCKEIPEAVRRATATAELVASQPDLALPTHRQYLQAVLDEALPVAAGRGLTHEV
jgi:hypothetical protein